MALSLRDRFFTPKVARAITSPSAIIATGVGVAAGVLLTANPIGAVVGGILLLAGRIGLAIPRAPRQDRVDPFTLDMPWRTMVQDALAAQTQFRGAVHRADAGPLRERLESIGSHIDEGVAECWRVARAGNALSDARSRIDVAAAQRELAEVQASGAPGATTQATIAAIQAQLDAATRMDGSITETRDRLRLLNARLDEAVTRSIELSVTTGDSSRLESIDDDVATITQEMEALRQGLEAVDTIDGTASGTAGQAG